MSKIATLFSFIVGSTMPELIDSTVLVGIHVGFRETILVGSSMPVLVGLHVGFREPILVGSTMPVLFGSLVGFKMPVLVGIHINFT